VGKVRKKLQIEMVDEILPLIGERSMLMTRPKECENLSGRGAWPVIA
jgi:hypothetical protein